jgi:hypothetical protein|tara:strand:+ start:222 stop:389 length:168 start_codon:yes stop_codon:yes gene_type:complete
MDNELETWTEKIMDEQQYRNGIFTDLKSRIARFGSNLRSGFTSKRTSHTALTKGE